MSMRLYLTAMTEAGDVQERCQLLYTSTTTTYRILGESILGAAGEPRLDRHIVMLRYFEWVDEAFQKTPGYALDHKLMVATFLVKYPNAEWYAG